MVWRWWNRANTTGMSPCRAFRKTTRTCSKTWCWTCPRTGRRTSVCLCRPVCSIRSTPTKWCIGRKRNRAKWSANTWWATCWAKAVTAKSKKSWTRRRSYAARPKYWKRKSLSGYQTEKKTCSSNLSRLFPSCVLVYPLYSRSKTPATNTCPFLISWIPVLPNETRLRPFFSISGRKTSLHVSYTTI